LTKAPVNFLSLYCNFAFEANMFVQLQFSGKLNRKTLSRLRSIDYNFDEQ